MSVIEIYDSVRDAQPDTPERAANIHTRVELMQKITAIVKPNGWMQTKAAHRCSVTQPRINDLLRGGCSAFRWMCW